jgi:hypothetical protein
MVGDLEHAILDVEELAGNVERDDLPRSVAASFWRKANPLSSTVQTVVGSPSRAR